MNTRSLLVLTEISWQTIMASALNYILAAMGLVCHLVPSQAHNTVSDSAVEQSRPLPRLRYPDGYVRHSDTVAYKFHSNYETWEDAKALCARENAGLAVIDTLEKVKHFMGLAQPSKWIHAGVIRINDTWMNINTESPVPPLPWALDEPTLNLDCVFLSFNRRGLTNIGCGNRFPYACEFPRLMKRNPPIPN